MATIEQRCLIHTHLETAFQVSQDYSCRSQWDPFAKNIQRDIDGLVSITAWHGMKMRVEYVSWQPPERAAIRMVTGPRILKRFAGSWLFSQHAVGVVEVRFRYQIQATHNWRFLEPLMLRYFKVETWRRLKALKRYLERPNRNNKGQTTVSDARIGARVACEIAEVNDYNESHCWRKQPFGGVLNVGNQRDTGHSVGATPRPHRPNNSH